MGRKYQKHFAKCWRPTASQRPGDTDRQRHHQRDQQDEHHRLPICHEPHGAALLHPKPAAQDAVIFQPRDRGIDAVGAQVLESASLQVIPHCLLRF